MIEEIRKMQVQFNNPNSSEQYKVMKETIAQFAAATNRSMSNAMLYLLKIGLEAEAQNQEILLKAKSGRQRNNL